MSELAKNLRKEFNDEDYRYSYDEEFSNSRMAAQIKVLREQRGLTQSRLAELAGMKQTRICALENVNYSAWSVSTLRRLARPLGVRFSFKFEGWGDLIRDADRFSSSSLKRPKFEEEFSKVGIGQTTVEGTITGLPLFTYTTVVSNPQLNLGFGIDITGVSITAFDYSLAGTTIEAVKIKEPQERLRDAA